MCFQRRLLCVWDALQEPKSDLDGWACMVLTLVVSRTSSAPGLVVDADEDVTFVPALAVFDFAPNFTMIVSARNTPGSRLSPEDERKGTSRSCRQTCIWFR